MNVRYRILYMDRDGAYVELGPLNILQEDGH
jgi:hypothetical protein